MYMVVGTVLEQIRPEYRVNHEFSDNLQDFFLFKKLARVCCMCGITMILTLSTSVTRGNRF